jgi:gas vesicle protein
MDWKDLSGIIGKAAPILGTLIGGPAGASIGALIASALGTDNTPTAVSQALQTNPDAAVKLAQIESDQKIKLAELATDQAKSQIAASQQSITDINKTMQTEAVSEHWPTYAWRPFIGFCFGSLGMVAGVTAAVSYIGVMFFKVDSGVLSQLPALIGSEAAVMATMAPVLGIASYFRGRMQADPNIPTINKG